MGKKVTIAYYCDGLDKCSDKPGCYRRMHTPFKNCCHTINPKHAKFGAVSDPENYPERFVKLDVFDDTGAKYWEGEIPIP